MRVFGVLALCLPLAGCFSLTGPKQVPEWAMQPQAAGEARAAPTSRTMRREPREPRRTVADRTDGVPTIVRPAGLAKDRERARVEQPGDITAYSPEWQAREDAADARLRRSMSICRGC